MKHQKLLIGCCLLSAGLIGCSQDHPGNLAQKRLEVHQEQYAQEYVSHDLSQQALNTIAADYERYGNSGPITLTVEYDPSSSQNNAMNATNHAALIAKGLRQAGVRDVKTEIMPVLDVGNHSKTLVTYDRFTAHAPEDCGLMPGLDNTTTDWKVAKTYEYGCSIEAGIAKQIARPKDLLGNEGFKSPSDGRRSGNIVDIYRSGAPNEPLEGETATDK